MSDAATTVGPLRPAAADALGLSRSAMYRRLEKLGLKPDEL